MITLTDPDRQLVNDALAALAVRHPHPKIVDLTAKTALALDTGSDDFTVVEQECLALALQGHAMWGSPPCFLDVATAGRIAERLGITALFRENLRSWLEFAEGRTPPRREGARP